MDRKREQLGRTTILNAAADAQRKEAVALYGMASRPERTIIESKKFAKLQAEPWMTQLALLMVRFARSQDITRGTWPLERFEQRLVGGGTPLPHGLTIDQAVWQVERAMADADARWFRRNIVRPLSRRLGSTLSGSPSTDESPHGESGSWIRMTYRNDKEQALVHLHDAARREVEELRDMAKWHEDRAVQAGYDGDRKEIRIQNYWRAVALAAALVLEKLAQAKDFDELELILRDRSELESAQPHESTLVVDAARQFAPMVDEDPKAYTFCLDIARTVRWQLFGLDEWPEDLENDDSNQRR